MLEIKCFSLITENTSFSWLKIELLFNLVEVPKKISNHS